MILLQVAMASPDVCEFEDDNLEDNFFGAIFKNDIDTATMLATVGQVDLNATNVQHKTPLFLAIEHENIPMVQMLINFGADINKPSYCGTQCYFETPVVTSARMERIDLVEMFLEHECELEGSGLKEGKTALQWAASYGDITMAKLLLDKGADINWIGPYFQTVLHYATLGDHPDMVKWILEKGAEIGVNGDGRSPLHIAAVRGNTAIVKHLIKHKCELDTIDKFNFSPFSLACLRGHFSIVKHFMDNSSPGTDLNLNDGLLRSAECGHLEVIEYLLSHNADVNTLNSLGESPLSIASRGQYISVQLLLQNGAKLNVVDKRGYTPLQHAVLREQIDIATTLIRHGAYLHTHCATVDSPLQMSVLVANARLVRCLLEAGCHLSLEKWFRYEISSHWLWYK